jgi:hypothetical protein
VLITNAVWFPRMETDEMDLLAELEKRMEEEVILDPLPKRATSDRAGSLLPTVYDAWLGAS